MISVLTLNIQGLRSLTSRQTLIEWLNCFGPDIVCLQETHAKTEQEFASWFSNANPNIRNKFKYKCISSPGKARSCGVAILFKPDFEILNTARDETGRFVSIDLCRNGFSFQIVCLYAPNTRQPAQAFFESMYPGISTDIPVFLCGDYNTVVDADLDRFGCNPNSPWAYNWSPTLTDLMSSFDLSDAWRFKHPTTSEFSWHRPNGLQKSRIDMVWMPHNLLDCVKSIEIFPFFRSDHSYVYLEFVPPAGIDRGPGLWKFNTSHLEDEAFCTSIVKCWTDWQMERARFSCLSSWWDAGKVRLKRLIRKYSRAKASEHKQKVKMLNSSIYHAQRRIDNGEQLHGLLEDVKAELAAELLKEAQGAQLRASTQWAEEGESSSAYFLRQEKIQGKRRLIGRIRRPDGSVAEDTIGILRVWQDFYFGLFSSQPLEEEEQNFFLEKLERKLSPDDAEFCEGTLSVQECLRALKAMPSGRSPGIDGFPAEFFLHFWDVLGTDLVAVLNSCYQLGSLSPSQRSGAITLLFKKDDPLDTKNWRPISLLCVDYKILAKALSNRLLRVIHKIVSPDQSCGIPGRFMGENLRLLLDIVHQANSEDLPGAILSLDQEKAFDRVEWSYMLKVLTHMGFGSSFCRWVSLLYSNVSSAVLVNGFLSESFPVSRGVRQGCPLSPLLYVLVAESLACAIRSDPQVDGFPLPRTRSSAKISQYADDTSVFVSSDNSIRALFHLFQRYELASGAKLNQTKCHGLLIGSWKSRTSLPVTLQWSSSHIIALGCRIGNDGIINWEPLVKKLTNLITSWKHRSLSFQGRSLIVNVLGLSRFCYLASVGVMPKRVITNVNKLVFSYVWAKAYEPIRRSSLSLPPKEGGLGIVNIDHKISSLHALWMVRFLLQPKGGWQSFFNNSLREHLRIPSNLTTFAFLQQNNLIDSHIKELPPFYRSVVFVWKSLRATFTNNEWLIPTTPTPTKLADLTARKIYRFLLRTSTPHHRCLDKFAEWQFPPIDWPAVWASLSLWRHVRPIRDSNWQIFHVALPTKDRLIRFRMNVPDPLCHCGVPESFLHIFLECPTSIVLLKWFFAILKDFNPSAAPPTPMVVLFGFYNMSHIPCCFTALLGIVRHRIWLLRNSYVFEHTVPDCPSAIAAIKSSFRFLLRLQKRHCSASVFNKEWLAGGVIGSISPSSHIRFRPDLSR